MNYADIKQYDVANGLGVRVSLFVSGCTHHCEECFNEEAWDFNYGEPYTQKEIDRIIEYMKPDYVAGLTVLGGEPFEPENQPMVLETIKQVRKAYPEKDIWCFSGYLFDKEIQDVMCKDNEVTRELIQNIDVLVDGEFMKDLKNLKLVFRGSENQRVINVKETLEKGEIVLWQHTYGGKE